MNLDENVLAQVEALDPESRRKVEAALRESVGIRRGKVAIQTTGATDVSNLRSNYGPKSYKANTSTESREAKRRRRQMEKRNAR
jgi:hypothetical protein